MLARLEFFSIGTSFSFTETLIFSTQALLHDVKFFVICFFAVREWNDRQTVDESNLIKSKTTFVCEHTTYLTLTKRILVLVVVISKFYANFFSLPQIPKTVKLSTGKVQLNAELFFRTFRRTLNPLNSYIECANAFAVIFLPIHNRLQIHLPTGYSISSVRRQILTVLPLPSIIFLESAKI